MLGFAGFYERHFGEVGTGEREGGGGRGQGGRRLTREEKGVRVGRGAGTQGNMAQFQAWAFPAATPRMWTETKTQAQTEIETETETQVAVEAAENNRPDVTERRAEEVNEEEEEEEEVEFDEGAAAFFANAARRQMERTSASVSMLPRGGLSLTQRGHGGEGPLSPARTCRRRSAGGGPPSRRVGSWYVECRRRAMLSLVRVWRVRLFRPRRRRRRGRTHGAGMHAATAAETAARAPALKAQEARARYGDEGAHGVRALEARLQARFDEMAEVHNPVLWPNMAIRM